MKIITHSIEEMMDAASALAKELPAGSLIALIGDLGAGKTVFVKGLAKGLGVKDHLYVDSPSFVILKEYRGGVKDLYHFDVYRLDLEAVRCTLDYERYFYGEGITAVEWADKIEELLPEEYIEIKFSHEGPGERALEIKAVGKKFEKAIEKIKNENTGA